MANNESNIVTNSNCKARIVIEVVLLATLVSALMAVHFYLLIIHHFFSEGKTDYIISLNYSFIFGSLIEPFLLKFFCFTKKERVKNIEPHSIHSSVLN